MANEVSKLVALASSSTKRFSGSAVLQGTPRYTRQLDEVKDGRRKKRVIQHQEAFFVSLDEKNPSRNAESV